MEISEDVVLKHVSVWINHGLLTFSSDRKALVASPAFQDSRYDGDRGLMDEMETAVSSDAQEAEDLKMLETYIVGMLSNFGSLPIQRIHNMLSTFARSGAQPCEFYLAKSADSMYSIERLGSDSFCACDSLADDKTISGLSVILGKLVDKGKLELVAGQYQRTK